MCARQPPKNVCLSMKAGKHGMTFNYQCLVDKNHLSNLIEPRNVGLLRKVVKAPFRRLLAPPTPPKHWFRLHPIADEFRLGLQSATPDH